MKKLEKWFDTGYLRLWSYLRSDRGASTTEYALLLTLVVVVLIGSLTALGAALRDKLNSIVTSLK